MENDITKLKGFIESSRRILITSHISPDPDAVSSLLLMGRTLMENYPHKQIEMAMEEEPVDLEFLAGYEQIKFITIYEELSKLQPDLFILLDGNSYERSSRFDGQKIRQYIIDHHIRTIIIDHHEQAGMDQADVYINHNYPATVQDVCRVCFEYLELRKPENYALTAMTGLYADTGGFAYMKEGTHQDVFTFASELVDAGARIEHIKGLLSQYSEDDMKILGELIANLSHGKDYSYSFISDETINEWPHSGNSQARLQKASGVFLDEFIRNIDGRKWGFIVYKNTLQGDDMYSVSLRSEGDIKDVSIIANKLGGGGHKPAAGARFKAENVKEALEKVKTAISGAVDED